MIISHFIALCFVFLAGVSLASPIQRDTASCAEYGQAGNLSSYLGTDRQQIRLGTATDGQRIKLVKANSTNEQFQFFQCMAPSDNFFGSWKSPPKPGQPEYFVYGQLRSTRYPGQCATAGNVYVRTDSTNTDGTPKYMTVPPDSDGTLTIEPCQTDGSDITRRQWMDLNPYKDDQHGTDMCNHMPVIGQAGKISDASVSGLYGTSDGLAFTIRGAPLTLAYESTDC
ncbi:hypothetical protein MYAM1_004096 [Malassezia yamatoensis]|uniref:Secreted protein n=1 Tax=Malassezia yamatoensis TaxID=253288 RepID=A0AAJ5YY23_9BASI|nr:hypothetical protein MYAM1_004096 [Malassezia yamatoensis]